MSNGDSTMNTFYPSKNISFFLILSAVLFGCHGGDQEEQPSEFWFYSTLNIEKSLNTDTAESSHINGSAYGALLNQVKLSEMDRADDNGGSLSQSLVANDLDQDNLDILYRSLSLLTASLYYEWINAWSTNSNSRHPDDAKHQLLTQRLTQYSSQETLTALNINYQRTYQIQDEFAPSYHFSAHETVNAPSCAIENPHCQVTISMDLTLSFDYHEQQTGNTENEYYFKPNQFRIEIQQLTLSNPLGSLSIKSQQPKHILVKHAEFFANDNGFTHNAGNIDSELEFNYQEYENTQAMLAGTLTLATYTNETKGDYAGVIDLHANNFLAYLGFYIKAPLSKPQESQKNSNK